MRVAADLLDRGCQISFPFGEDCDYDLIADCGGVLHRVQVKYAESDGVVVVLRCQSHSLTNGKVRATKRYTAASIDWIVAYDRTTDCCYYCPAWKLGSGCSSLCLRLTPTRNGQVRRVRNAADYLDPDFSEPPGK